MVVVIDPQIAGVSGDMLLSSLVDLGADGDKIASGISGSAGLAGSKITRLEFGRVQKRGIDACRLVLEFDEQKQSRKGTEILAAVTASVRGLGLSERARAFAESSVGALISSEAAVHGVSADSVHFHEASSIDTLVDIVGTAIALDDLGIFGEEILCMPVSVGNGSVTFSHGTMSNPASAILEILRGSGIAIRGTDSGGELATPTGACLLAGLGCRPATHYPLMTVDAVGYGAGDGDFEAFANVLKLVRGTGPVAPPPGLEADSVKVLETNIDDVSGEVLGALIGQVMERGARDISVCPGITKKGRPTSVVSVICDDSTMGGIVESMVATTGTLGMRVSDSDRLVVRRTEHSACVSVGGETFDVRYKRSFFGKGTGIKIEFDDLQRISKAAGKPLRETEQILLQGIGEGNNG